MIHVIGLRNRSLSVFVLGILSASAIWISSTMYTTVFSSKPISNDESQLIRNESNGVHVLLMTNHKFDSDDTRQLIRNKNNGEPVHVVTKHEQIDEFYGFGNSREHLKGLHGMSVHVEPSNRTGCHVCNLENVSRPRLYMIGRDDGVGAHFVQMSTVAVLTKKLGLNFGGFVTNYNTFKYVQGRGPFTHGINVSDVMEDIFDQKLYFDYREILRLNPYRTNSFSQVKSFVSQMLDNGRPIILETGLQGMKGINLVDSKVGVEMRMQGAFFLRRHQWLLEFRHKSCFTVAVHVRTYRKDDIYKQALSQKILKPTKYFANVLNQILLFHPNLDVHVFTPNMDGILEVFSTVKMNITYHVSNDEPNTALLELYKTIIHFVGADILVAGRSNLSYLSGILSGNCVISGPGRWFDGMKSRNWIQAVESGKPHAGGELSPRLLECVNYKHD